MVSYYDYTLLYKSYGQALRRPLGAVMLLTGKELRAKFKVGDRTYTKVRRIIINNPDRYSVYASVGRVTDDRAFADAYKYKSLFEKGYKLPPYNPEEAEKIVREFS